MIVITLKLTLMVFSPLSASEVDPECLRGNTNTCSLKFYDHFVSYEFEEAAAHAKVGCNYENYEACGSAATALLKLKKYREARHFAHKGCRNVENVSKNSPHHLACLQKSKLDYLYKVSKEKGWEFN